MAAASRLGKQIAEIVSALDVVSIPFALIGGLALASHKVIRATQDVDLLIDSNDADRVDSAVKRLGYRNIHRSSDAGNYQRGDERLDLLYASRTPARRLLAAAPRQETSFGVLPVIGPEGLIGFKLQALVNDPRRIQDMADIRALLHANRATLNMEEVREYFRLFDREPLLDEILRETH
ncbi:MAG: hypothetical protein ACYDB9_12170 [Gammaproteobacteria bacterium]